jgi:hypothetical protein
MMATNAATGLEIDGEGNIRPVTVVVGAPFKDSNVTGVNGNQSNNSQCDDDGIPLGGSGGCRTEFFRSGSLWAVTAGNRWDPHIGVVEAFVFFVSSCSIFPSLHRPVVPHQRLAPGRSTDQLFRSVDAFGVFTPRKQRKRRILSCTRFWFFSHFSIAGQSTS